MQGHEMSVDTGEKANVFPRIEQPEFSFL